MLAHRPEPWPPKELQLPDTIAAIEQGRPPRQRSLFPPDDSREARIKRLATGREGGVKTNHPPGWVPHDQPQRIAPQITGGYPLDKEKQKQRLTL